MEKPACLLGAGRGGACGVWDFRQRRHKHTDTGSLEQKKSRRRLRETIPNSWTTFSLYFGENKLYVKEIFEGGCDTLDRFVS